MTSDRNQIARELLAFYVEAGVDVALGETAVDRFADAAEVSPQPAIGRPADQSPRADHPQPGDRPALDRSRPAAPVMAAPIPLSPDTAVMAAREEAKSAKTLDELRAIL